MVSLPVRGSPRLWQRTRADRRPDLRQGMEGITRRQHQLLEMANVPSCRLNVDEVVSGDNGVCEDTYRVTASPMETS